MKISNETKVGSLTAITIAILILGFNFLKGRNLMDTRETIYSVFPDIKGLQVSNAVVIKGLQVGKISAMRETDSNLSGIIVEITLNKDINIPRNSQAMINSDLLGSSTLEILLGDDPVYIQPGDTLRTVEKEGIMSQITQSLNPALANINKTLNSLDDLIQQLNATLDTNTQENLQRLVASLSGTSRELEKLIRSQSASLGKTVSHVEAITGAVAGNKERIENTLANLEQTTANLSKADIQETMQSVSRTMKQLEKTVAALNSKEGSLGMLLHDRQLYEEIRMTNRSLTMLLDDLRIHPRRYVNISVFGRKDRTGPILQPAYYDSSSRN